LKISVIVPLFNEAAGLAALRDHLLPLCAPDCEVLLIDGGSQDDTAALAAELGFRVIDAERGRASQMNAGASVASGDILLFLHADTRLPDGALERIRTSLQEHRRENRRNPRCWGRFDVRIEGRSPLLRVVAWLMNWRSRLSGIATGDQGIFVTRQAFDQVGGFPQQPLMEDIEISKRLLRRFHPFHPFHPSRPVCLTEKVVTSGRRWEAHGVWPTIWLMWRLRWQYWRGVPASRLAREYE
jgi:rSAM/selenodomain-associated transferase 2